MPKSFHVIASNFWKIFNHDHLNSPGVIVATKLTDDERIRIARLLAVLDRNAVIGVREIAVLANTTPDRVYQASSSARVAKGGISLKLPPRVTSIGRSAGWLHGDVRDMLGHCISDSVSEAQKSLLPPEPAMRKGRPRQA